MFSSMLLFNRPSTIFWIKAASKSSEDKKACSFLKIMSDAYLPITILAACNKQSRACMAPGAAVPGICIKLEFCWIVRYRVSSGSNCLLLKLFLKAVLFQASLQAGKVIHFIKLGIIQPPYFISGNKEIVQLFSFLPKNNSTAFLWILLLLMVQLDVM